MSKELVLYKAFIDGLVERKDSMTVLEQRHTVGNCFGFHALKHSIKHHGAYS